MYIYTCIYIYICNSNIISSSICVVSVSIRQLSGSQLIKGVEPLQRTKNIVTRQATTQTCRYRRLTS